MRMNYGTQLAFRTPNGAQIMPADGESYNLTYKYSPYGLPVFKYPVIRLNANTRRHNVSALHVSVVQMIPDGDSAIASFAVDQFTLEPDSRYTTVIEVPGQFLDITVRSDVAEGENAMDLEVYGFIPYAVLPQC